MRLLCIAAQVYKNTDKKTAKHHLALYAAYSNDTATLYHTKASKPTAQTKKHGTIVFFTNTNDTAR